MSIAAVESEASIAAETAADLEELPEGIGAVIVDRGPNAGSRFLLENTMTAAGRHPESEIFLDDVTVSRRHAVFERRAGGYVLRDVGSLNGTYVNGDRVDEYELRNGDEVQIGRYRLLFLVGGSG
jgi:pSer/pThr/pTyr-binding forkhead associated (FHA) protein